MNAYPHSRTKAGGLLGTRLNRTRFKQWLTFGVLVAPALTLFAVMMLWPLANMFRVSLLDWQGIIKPSTYAGLDNFTRMFTTDIHFKAAVSNTLRVMAIALPATIIPAYMLGFFLSLRPRGHRLFRTIFFSPAMLSAPGIAMVFLGTYLPDGIINHLLREVGLDALTRVWLADKSTSLGAVAAVEVWGGIGFYSVLFYASLSNISSDLYEAARIDGASTWKIMWQIAFPIARDFVGIATMLHFMWLLLGSAQTVLLLTKGGPGDSSLTLAYYLYKQAFQVRNLGYSQAIGVFIFFVGLTGMLVIRQATRRRY